MMRRDEGRGGKREGNARTEENTMVFITHLYSHDDATIKDWRYHHAAVAGGRGRMSKSEYQILGTVGMTLAENAGEDQEISPKCTPPRRRGNGQVVPRNQS